MVNKSSSYLIQSNFGTKGNFEVVMAIGGSIQLQHWYRDDNNLTLPWVQTQ
jgi:hypothetical protein